MSIDELLRPPSEALARKIKEEIGEDDERFQNSLKLFAKWIECEPHLPKNYEPNMLAVFLRGCKHDMVHAKRKFEQYVVARSTMPDLFGVKTYPEKIANNAAFTVVPDLTDDGYRVKIFALRDPSLDLYDTDTMMHMVWRIGKVRTCKEKLNGGDVFILDAKNYTAMHATKLFTPMVRKAMFVGQDALAVRIRQVHIINAPAYMEKFVGMFKLLFSEKIRKRFTVHGGISTITNYVPVRCLPKEYGGTADSIDVIGKRWKDYMDANELWFVQQEQVKLRGSPPKRCKLFEEDLGVQGSFRKLGID